MAQRLLVAQAAQCAGERAHDADGPAVIVKSEARIGRCAALNRPYIMLKPTLCEIQGNSMGCNPGALAGLLGAVGAGRAVVGAAGRAPWWLGRRGWRVRVPQARCVPGTA